MRFARSHFDGQEVEFRVSERAFRHYTPARFDPERGALDIVFFLHGEGPGTTWVRKLRQGQQANVWAPEADSRFCKVPRPTCCSVTRRRWDCSPACQPRRLDDVSARWRSQTERKGSPAWPSLIGLELPAVQRTGARGDALVRWIETNDIARSHDVCFYLAGHTGSIVQIREHLLHRGWPKRNTVPRRTGRMASEGSEKIPSDGRSPAAMGAHRARLSSR